MFFSGRISKIVCQDGVKSCPIIPNGFYMRDSAFEVFVQMPKDLSQVFESFYPLKLALYLHYMVNNIGQECAVNANVLDSGVLKLFGRIITTWAVNLTHYYMNCRWVLCVWVLGVFLDGCRETCQVLFEPVTAKSNCHPVNTSAASRGHVRCSSRLSYSSHKAVASICCRYFCQSEIHVNVCQAGIMRHKEI